MTQPLQSAIVELMVDAAESKRQFLAAELQRYFGETYPALVTRWEVAIVGMAPPLLRELVGRLKRFETLTNQVSGELSGASAAAADMIAEVLWFAFS